MKKHTQRRGLMASVGALLTAAALALGGAAAAQAAPPQPVPESTPVTIKKMEQPDALGAPATGKENSAADALEGIGGVIFDYYLVTDTGVDGANDIGTNDGQEYAGGLTAASAPIAAEATGSFPATQSSNGVTSKTLPRGLYVVKERPASVPAGVTASADFLLSVPLTNPSELNAWLDHIYVYPKNSKIAAEKSVVNADDLVVGDEVTWTIKTDIPRVENPDYVAGAEPATPKFVATDLFRIDDTLNIDELSFVSAAVSAGGTSLIGGTDYNITPVNVLADPEQPEDPDTNPVVAITQQILFTPEGLDALATAVNADAEAQVVVELTTTVLAAEEIDNVANVFPNQNSVTQNKPLITNETDVRYGSINFEKASSNGDLVNLSGAKFQVYTTEEAAKSLDEDFRVTPTDNAGVVQSEWTSAEDGSFTIQGLRYSGYADGEGFGDEDTRYQTYWLIEVVALDGHQLLAEPLEFAITGDADADGFKVVNQENTGGFVLPLTGGMGTAILTIAGIAILAIVLVVARRRRTAEASAE